jgi:hypothetical protein
MGDRGVGLPLAFLLAMSTGDAGKELSRIAPDQRLERGSLSGLLSGARANEGQYLDSDGHVAQWFNAVACANAVWRRC